MYKRLGEKWNTKYSFQYKGEWRRFAKRLYLLESWSRFLTSTTSPRIPKENFPCGLQNSETTGQRTTRNGVAVRTIVLAGPEVTLNRNRPIPNGPAICCDRPG